MSYDSTILAEPSLVSYWKLNETSGSAAADSANGNPGTYLGGYTLAGAPPGSLLGGSTLFNGSTGNVQVPTAANLHPTAALSIEAWVKLTGTDGNHHSILEAGYTSQTPPYVDYILGINNSNQFKFGLTTAGAELETYSSSLTAGVWYYVVGTYDGANLKLYINTSLVSTTAKTGAVANNNQLVSIARAYRGGYNSEAFGGSVSSAALYSDALTPAQITSHYNASGNPNVRISQEALLSVGQATPSARVSQEGLLTVGQAVPQARVSQEGLLTVGQAVPKARVSQMRLLLVVPNYISPNAPKMLAHV